MMCWLCQLRGAADEVDHIFDVLDYEIIGSSSSQPDDPSAAERGGAASIGSAELCGRLKKLLAKLNDIRQSSRGLMQASMLAVAGAGPDGCSRPVTGPLLPQGLIPLGYDGQYEDLLAWLLQPPQGKGGGVTVLAIIGHGGMGKTTLAQRVWGDEHVQGTFDLVIWAWVYNKTSEADLLGEIWRSAAAAERRRHEQMSFGGMQLELQKLVASRRYLLVLDDVCNDEAATERQRRDMWSAVLAPFRQPEDIGSRVLVTTRAVICADTLGADSSRRLTLDGIGHEAFVRLLSGTAAFGAGGSVEEATRARRELQQFLRSSSLFPEPEASSASASWLASNWRCSPLSAKEMGLELRDSRGKTKWAEIMATDSHSHRNSVVSVHESSFRHLPPHLQHCCAFISLFPNKFRFLPEMLVKMWIADGFISGDDGSSCTSMEETARGYLNDLLARSLLQPVQDGDKTYYVVHEQIHSMIRSVSASYFRMIQPNYCSAAKIPHTVRHLSVTTGCVARLKKLSLLKRLRTFILLRDPDPSAVVTAIDEDLLKELEGVRVLDFTGTDIKDVPSEIGNLIHLRCLALPQTVQAFPEEFSKLFHLQTLIRSKSKYDQTDEVHYHTGLDVAFTLNATNRRSLRQLKRMNSLRGSLIITGLSLVASEEDAQKAQLNSKKSVRVLTLEWEAKQSATARFLEFVWEATARRPTSATDLDVLEGLQPHTGLQMLHIKGYRGISSPSWLLNNCLSQLTHLHIINCRNWNDLPRFGDLPLLNHLEITDLESVTEIDGCGPFKSLETLVLSDMTSLEEWWTAARATDSGGLFTALKKIEIFNCPILKLPPPFPPTLELLRICNCPELRDKVRKRYRGVPQPILDVDFLMW
ncbi:putative disease resistance RPP13-like protein 1 [Panicum hallii]|nr:putative disease resistance RPP13-like protein 1 [Panicum hallii]